MTALLPFLLIAVGSLIWAQLLARAAARDLDRRARPLDGSAYEPALRPALGRLADALDVPEVRVHVLDVPVVNGLAAPDGRVVLTRGLLDRMRAGALAPEEVAGVVAHELGHVALGHARRRMIDVGGRSAVGTALMLALSRVLGGAGVMLAQFLVGLVASGLSRRDEFEADAYASALLIRAGIGTGPQKSLFRKLPGLTGNGAEGAPAWLLTHPKPAARIAAIEANERRWLGDAAG